MDRLTQRRIIRKFYGLSRPVTEQERVDTVAMLERKKTDGQLDSLTIHLAASLRVI